MWRVLLPVRQTAGRVVGVRRGQATVKAGLSTERCDRSAAEAAVAEVYRAHDLPVPRTVVWRDSPLGGALAFWVLRHGCEDRLEGTLLADPVAGPPLSVSREFARHAEERIREQLPVGRDGLRWPEAGGGGRGRRRLADLFPDLTGAQRHLVAALGSP